MTSSDLPAGTRLWKAHGTGNCFLLVDDPEGRRDLSAAAVEALCDASRGIGADGLIRAARRGGRWFMDYRNADGSPAQMCGNGVRVFVDHLRRRGLVALGVGESLEVLTRGGVRSVRALGSRPAQVVTPVWERALPALGTPSHEGGPAPVGPRPVGGGDPSRSEEWYEVDMGPAQTSGVADTTVRVLGIEGTLDGISVAMPNPHVVVDVGSREALRDAVLPTTDVHRSPRALRPVLDPDPESGTNLELVVDVTAERDTVGRLLMRVLERGVGETRSCGTGCCAAAVAAAARRGPGAPRRWIVEVPGGAVVVDLGDPGPEDTDVEPEDTPPGLGGAVPGSRDGVGRVVLSGPATPVAELVLAP